MVRRGLWSLGLGVRILGGLGFRSIFWLLRSLNCYYPQLAALAGGLVGFGWVW